MLLDDWEFQIIPVLNVDGYEYTHASPNNRMWRKNRKPNPGSTCVGTDLNRNYGFRWNNGGSSSNPCTETYHGGSPLDAKEVNDITNFLTRINNTGRLAGFVDIHSYGGMFMSCWGWTTSLPAGYGPMEAVMEASVDAIYNNGNHLYDYGSTANTIYLASGVSTDWCLGTYALANSYTIEVWGNSFVAPVTQIEPLAIEVWAGLKAMLQAM